MSQEWYNLTTLIVIIILSILTISFGLALEYTERKYRALLKKYSEFFYGRKDND